MPIAGPPSPPQVAVSAAGELAWLGGLLSGRAAYCEPALRELGQSLLPGIEGHLQTFARRLRTILPEQGPAGCTEVLVLAERSGSLAGEALDGLFEGFEEAAMGGVTGVRLELESSADRRGVENRLRVLARDEGSVRAYRQWLRDVWTLAEPAWEERGAAAARVARDRLAARIEAGVGLAELVSPRHPLAAALRVGSPALDLLESRPVLLSPLYFCMSGGHLVDVGELVHVGLPASGLAPIRKAADAMYTAHLVRVLNEHARVLVLIDLLTTRSTVMELSRRLGMAQPTVSAHVRQLQEAGLITPVRQGGRSVFAADRRRIAGLLDDVRSVLLKWESEPNK